MSRDYLRMSTGYYHRPRIDALLEKGLQYSLISVIAGPGYGKTQAVGGYAIQTPMRLVWMRLEQSDNDIYRLWMHVAESMDRELPELAEQLRQTALPSLMGAYDVLRQLFSAELEKGPGILLVLDNLECMSSGSLFDILQLLLKTEIQGLHIIVISNEKLAVGSIVPSSGQLRVSMDDLGFTDEEIAGLFAIYGMKLTPEDIGKIAESTGRWPLALHLICVNRNGDELYSMQEMTHQQLASELFDRHYFSEYDPQYQAMLVKLSCFERFPLELVNLLAAENTGRFLETLYRNTFISYDYNRELFRFQTMYKVFLGHRQALIPEEEKRELYRYMGGWFREHAFFYEAMDCFWYLRDYDSYLGTVFQLPRVRRSMRITSEILAALNDFPEEYALKNPALDFAIAILQLNALQPRKAEAQLHTLIHRLMKSADKDVQVRRLLGDCYIVLADISLLLNRDDGLAYMKKAAELLPHGGRVRSRDLMLVGNNNVFFMPDNRPGERKRMEEYFFAYAAYSDRVTHGSGFGLEWLFAAQAAFLAEELARSRDCCLQAIAKATSAGQHDIICNAYWDLMRTELYVGDYPQAKKWLDELTGYIDTRRIADLYELRDCAASWFYLRMGDAGKVARWVADVAPMNLDHVVDIGRNRIIIIYYLCEQGRKSEAYAQITHLEDIFRESGRWHERILLMVHKAAQLLDRGEKQEAVAEFKQAYDMVYQNDISAIFAEFGKLSQRLVRAATSQTAISFDNEWLEAVYRRAGSFEKRAVAMRKAYHNRDRKPEEFGLNAREMEILGYIAQGMTRPEVAQLMGTSLGNIKRYMTNIYTKLGALNRADAIHIATLNGLVGKEGEE